MGCHAPLQLLCDPLPNIEENSCCTIVSVSWFGTLQRACESLSVLSDSLWAHGLYSPWHSPGQNTGVGSLFLFQRIFPAQRSNPGLSYCWIFYQLSYKGWATKIMVSGPINLWQIDGETAKIITDFIFGSSKITADGDCSHEIKRRLLLGRKDMTNLDSILKSRDIADKGLFSQSCGFSSSHVWIWELDYKESWALKNWCFWNVVLEKTLESPWTARRTNQSILNSDQSWIFIGRTNGEAKTPVLWPPDAKNWLIWKDPDAEKDWRWEEKRGTTEDEMVG